jgi:hypothetical protein
MPFIGNQPALSYTSFAKQDFTTSATTSYTLDHPVTNENEIALFINFVRQEPTTAYTASGTSLTLTSATSASDDMYCVFLGKAVQTVNPPSGSVGLSQLSATGTKDSTTFLRGDNTFASAGGDMTPAFQARLSTNQSISDNTDTKVQFNTEDWDTDSAYDNSTNYRFTVPSGEAGKYFIYFSIQANPSDLNYGVFYSAKLHLNGTRYTFSKLDFRNNTGSSGTLNWSGALDLSVGDYLEVFASVDTTTGTPSFTASSTIQTFFGGYKLIGV